MVRIQQIYCYFVLINDEKTYSVQIFIIVTIYCYITVRYEKQIL